MGPDREQPRDALPPGMTSRSTIIKVDAESLDGLRKRAFTAQFGGSDIYCDEPEQAGGTNTAPPPMIYFAAAVLF